MPSYTDLRNRLDNGEVIILDGAVGTQLQSMGAPMHPVGWCGPANDSHPATVGLMHERYIKAGADVITTNTFSTIRPKLIGSGYGEKFEEINIRAVRLAQEARDRVASDRPVYIAGSISSHIGHIDRRSGVPGGGDQPGLYTAPELKAYYGEVADVLAEAGVDFFLLEHVGSDNEARMLAAEAVKDTGLPFWVGFTASTEPPDDTVFLRNRQEASIRSTLDVLPEVRVINRNCTLAKAVQELVPLGPDVMSVFHSTMNVTNSALSILSQHWSGPKGAYPDAGRTDYTLRWKEEGVTNEESEEQFASAAYDWVGRGIQVIGACCGFGPSYIRPLRNMLPDRIPSTVAR